MATVKDPSISAGDYDYLEEALAAAETSITIEGDWDNDDTTAASVDTDNTTITATGSSKHTGRVTAWDTQTGHHRMAPTSGSHVITINNGGCTIDGLVIAQKSGTGSAEGVRVANSGTNTIKNCIIFADQAVGTDQDGIYSWHAHKPTLNVENCVIYGFGRSGIQYQTYGGSGSDTNSVTYNINSCTICLNNRDTSEANGGGIASMDLASTGLADFTLNINVKNCIVMENHATVGVEDFQEYAGSVNVTTVWDVHHCISSDGSADSIGTSEVGNSVNDTLVESATPSAGEVAVYEINAANREDWDFRLRDHANNEAQDMHTSAQTPLDVPTTDIIGTTRYTGTAASPTWSQGSGCDCGAFEIVAAGGATRRVMVVS